MLRAIYSSEIGPILLESDGTHLTRVSFWNSENTDTFSSIKLPAFEEIVRWLDIYFRGDKPDFMPDFKIEGLTPFRKLVLEILQRIPYGKTITYKEIAEEIAVIRGMSKMSSQAVGGAVGWNPIGILIPCHRVVGTNGSLTGYAGGLKNKIALLKLEGIETEKFLLPKEKKINKN